MVGLLGGVTATLAFLTEFSPDVIFGVAAIFGPSDLGLVVRHAEDTAAVVALEAERARVEEALATKRSTLAMQDRIARDIHDVLAHSLSLMVVQAALAKALQITTLLPRNAQPGSARRLRIPPLAKSGDSSG